MMYGSLQHDFSGRKRRKSKVKGEVYGKFKKPAFEQHAVPIVKTYAMVRLEEAHRIPSNTDFSTARPESTAKPERKEYTGTLVKGISTLHKSNAVPIISQDDAFRTCEDEAMKSKNRTARRIGALQRLKASVFFEKKGRSEKDWQSRVEKEVQILEKRT